MSVVAVGFAEPRLVICPWCKGSGHAPGNQFINCERCGGDCGYQTDDWPLATLSHNLSIAAGLCAAWDLGQRGAHRIWTHWDHNDASLWKPGCGKAAP